MSKNISIVVGIVLLCFVNKQCYFVAYVFFHIFCCYHMHNKVM